jgi:hypothetical protein
MSVEPVDIARAALEKYADKYLQFPTMMMKTLSEMFHSFRYFMMHRSHLCRNY